ncbi:response regulator transcription factor [Sphingobacterium sp.]|uniref:response regulator transcription factor n=1 Tax=Sphingobacterium sp. TaxID=341027 RepID=UPI002FDD6962
MVILIAEDNELILRTIEYKLTKAGHEVIVTTNGKEAIEKINTLELDLIITDIMMPFASGIEVLYSIKKLEKKIPVIVLSNMGQEEVVIEAFDLGASDFMVKPFSPEELLLRVNRLTSHRMETKSISDSLS